MPQDTGQMHVQARSHPTSCFKDPRKDSQLEHFVKNTAIKSHQRGCPCHQQGHTTERPCVRARLGEWEPGQVSSAFWDPHVKLGQEAVTAGRLNPGTKTVRMETEPRGMWVAAEARRRSRWAPGGRKQFERAAHGDGEQVETELPVGAQTTLPLCKTQTSP